MNYGVASWLAACSRIGKPRLWERAPTFGPSSWIQSLNQHREPVLSQRSHFKSPLPASVKNSSQHAIRAYFLAVTHSHRSSVFTGSPLTSHQLKMSAKEIPSITKRRGVIRSSITRLANRLNVLESKPPNRDTLEAAQQTLQRLSDLQAEFKILHFELIDLIEDEKALDKEQEIFDTVDEQVDDTKVRIKKIIHNCSSVKDTSKDELFFISLVPRPIPSFSMLHAEKRERAWYAKSRARLSP